MKRIFTRSLFLYIFLFSFLVVLPSSIYAAVYSVDNNNDSGPGSLRAASAAANGDAIIFSQTSYNIVLTSGPITFSNPDVIFNGFNISGAAPGNTKIIISGSISTAFIVNASNVTIKGFTFQGFSSRCIDFTNATNFTVQGCIFGMNNTATATVSTPAVGVYVGGTGYGLIGGSAAGDGNVFYTSGINGACIQVYNVTATNVTSQVKIIGNKMGTNYAGTASFSLAGNCGIKCSYAKYITIGGLLAGEGNQIDGCVSASGIWSDPQTGGSYFFTIQGNKIGTLAGCYNGILMGSGITQNFIIGSNKINNSGNYGIEMSASTSNQQIKISQNLFSNNTNGAINNAYTPPTISYATTGKIGGIAAGAGATVEIFDWDGLTTAPQGSTYIASVTADASGNWFYYGSFALGQKLVVNTTPASGNPSTTKFSTAFTVTSCPSTVSAGTAQTVCSTSSTIALNGGSSNASNPNWTFTGGTGTLSNPNTYVPTYNLSAAEQATTSDILITFQLTVSTATCAATINSSVVMTIKAKPIVNAGPNQTFCANASGGVTLAGSVTNATGGTWTGGAGTFSPNANALNATYTPSVGEKVGGTNITLTLTSTGNGVCTATASTMNINVTNAPTVNAGADQTVCANAFPVSLVSTKTVATGVSWSGGGGSYSPNASATSISYQPTTGEIAAGTITLTVTTTGNGSCSPVADNVTIIVTPAPVVNAGPDQSACVPAGSIALSGSVTVASGGVWTTTGLGTIASSTSLNTTYVPTAAENSITTPTTITFTLKSTGNGGCNVVTDQMVLTLTPAPIVNAGSDRNICSNNTNVFISGSISGAPNGSWTTSGSGTFSNPNNLNTFYTPSNADRTSGTVTLTLNSSGGGCLPVSDAMTITINPCLIDPQLSFESPTLFKSNGSTPFKHNFAPLNSTGAITYAIATPTSCATIDANGYVTVTCVDTIVINAYQAVKSPYNGDTASYILYIGKAVTTITLESRGSDLAGAPFQLQATTNYDQPLTYSIVGGDLNAITMTSGGVITPVALGTVIIRASAAGDLNYQAASSNDVSVTIYPTLTKPVAINDTLNMLIAEQKTIRLADNDYGTTASINLSPMLIDIDSENPGLQTKYFKPGIGIFTIDTTGLLTFAAFEAFIGTDSIQYTITDANGLVSNKASLVLNVSSPVAEIALKANEIITANGDNLNNALVIGYTDLSQSNDLLIVDAAGNKLFYAKDYQNNWSATDSSGRDLGNGVYYFIFREFDHAGGVRRQLKGNFTVIR